MVKFIMGSFMALGVFATSAYAEIPSSSARLADGSKSAGLWEAGAQLTLSRNSGSNVEATKEKLMRALGLPEASRAEITPGTVLSHGADWVLDVWDNGNAGAFRKDRGANPAKLEPKAIPAKREIVDAALGALRTRLAGHFALGKDETLVLLAVHAEFAGSQEDKAGAPRVEHVMGWEVTFGRAVGGRLVLGGGSHIRLGFDARGELESLHFDWPSYSNTTRRATTASKATVDQRVKAMKAKLPKNTKITEEELECGWVDVGVRPGDRSQGVSELVPGCQLRMVMQTADASSKNTFTSGVIEFISALEKEEPLPSSRESAPPPPPAPNK